MSRIYISSTFTDLKDHRAAVARAVRRLGHTDVAMEYYVAEHQRPLDKCLRDAGSCDLYVGIFARRYGFCPDGRDQSITELELREAEHHQIDCLCFLLDEQADWPEDQVEHGDGAQKLADLRAEIAGNYLAGFFSTPDELAAVATASIVRALNPGPTPFDATREYRLWRQWLSADTPVRERVKAGQALAGMGSPLYVAEIKRRLLEADDVDDVERVARYLEELQHLAASRGELMPIFRDLLDSNGGGRRYFAVFQLGELALRGVNLAGQILEEVVKLADDPAPGVRAELAHTLGKLTPTNRERADVRATLNRLAADPNQQVRDRAEESIEKLGYRS